MAARQTGQMEYLFNGSGPARRLAHDQRRSAARAQGGRAGWRRNSPRAIPEGFRQARLPRHQQGPCEEVDPIDAAIAITSKQGVRKLPREVVDDPRPQHDRKSEYNYGPFSPAAHKQVEQALNLGKEPGDWRKLERVARYPRGGDLLFIDPMETPNEARKRWQHEVSPEILPRRHHRQRGKPPQCDGV